MHIIHLKELDHVTVNTVLLFPCVLFFFLPYYLVQVPQIRRDYIKPDIVLNAAVPPEAFLADSLGWS